MSIRRRVPTYPSGGGTPTPFDFSTIQGANLTNWTAGHQIVGASDGDRVEVPNLGTAGGTWVNATSTQRPEWKDAILNGLPVLRGNGNTALDLTGKTIYDLLTTSAWTLFAVYKIATAGNNLSSLNGGNANTLICDGSGGIWGISNNFSQDPDTIGAYHFSGGAYTTTITSDFVLGNFHIIEYRRESGNNSIRKNDESAVITAAGNLNGAFGGTPRLFTSNAGQRMIGDIAEVLMWNIALDGTDTADVRSELATMYGVTV